MPVNTDIHVLHGIVLRSENREANIDGRPVLLTKTEFQLLFFLASHAGVAHTRREIIEAVQGANYPATDRSVDIQVMGLRKKMGEYQNLIQAVRGVGYRFKGCDS
jgi:two-component system alkaline phosphatase synthesis response regulator PhoP